MKKDQVRITIAITKELYDKIGSVAQSYGMSKSGLVAYYVGRSVETELSIRNQTPNMVNAMMKMLLERGDIPEFTDGNGVKHVRDVDQPDDEKAEGF
jgi:hypothetical protein